MAEMNFHKVTALPGTLEPNAVYAVDAGAPHVELYVADQTGATARRIPTTDDIQNMIDATPSGVSAMDIVDDIAARDSLVSGKTANAIILVLDASADATVASGAATYAYRHSNTSLTKISEAESQDVVQQWANIQGKPTSSVANIDDAVGKRHAHANATELAKIGQDGDGNLTYDGNLPKIGWDTNAW